MSYRRKKKKKQHGTRRHHNNNKQHRRRSHHKNPSTAKNVNAVVVVVGMCACPIQHGLQKPSNSRLPQSLISAPLLNQKQRYSHYSQCLGETGPAVLGLRIRGGSRRAPLQNICLQSVLITVLHMLQLVAQIPCRFIARIQRSICCRHCLFRGRNIAPTTIPCILRSHDLVGIVRSIQYRP